MTEKSQITQLALASLGSDLLGKLREIEEFKELLGTLVQFTLVVDANIILGDLIWIVKRKNPNATTKLMESIKAGTVVVYITRSVLMEIDQHITTIATKRNLSEDILRQEWKKYRKLVKVRTLPERLVDQFIDGQDPDDAPTLALQKMLRADGILTKDFDIEAMGGPVIELDFTTQLREYSRQTAVAVSIRLSGEIAMMVSWTMAESILELAKSSVKRMKALPLVVQIILICVVVIIVANPYTGKYVKGAFSSIAGGLSSYLPMILDLLTLLYTEYERNNVPPPIPQIKIAKNRAIDLQENT